MDRAYETVFERRQNEPIGVSIDGMKKLIEIMPPCDDEVWAEKSARCFLAERPWAAKHRDALPVHFHGMLEGPACLFLIFPLLKVEGFVDDPLKDISNALFVERPHILSAQTLEYLALAHIVTQSRIFL
jgi:hypothetical protein